MMKLPIPLVILLVMLVLSCFLWWPEIDLTVSGWFYESDKKFSLAIHPLFLFMHSVAYYGARVLGVGLFVVAMVAFYRKAVWGISGKAWLFLFIALMVGPVLLANVILKDHWGRARPREVAEFGGVYSFSPAWIPQQHARRNDSFVAGDAAFGFFLSSFAYVVPLAAASRRREKPNLSRRVFWGGMAAGSLFGFARIAMGAHFLSDVLFAAFFMLGTSALLHLAMFGSRATAIYWRNWFFVDAKKAVTPG